ncbi:hypothetical protein ACHAWF_016519 [Thalassiosira exigua]
MDFDSLAHKKRIQLVDKGLKDADMDMLVRILSESTSMLALILGKNQITLADGAFCRALATNRTLLVLNLHCNNIGDEGIKHLAKAIKANQHLQTLHLNGNRIGDKGASYLADAFAKNKSIRKVYLKNNRGITDVGAQKLTGAIKGNKTVTHFVLSPSIGSTKKIRCSQLFQAIFRTATLRNQVKMKDEEIARKDQEIASLKAQLTSLKCDEFAIGEITDPSNKRPRTHG